MRRLRHARSAKCGSHRPGKSDLAARRENEGVLLGEPTPKAEGPLRLYGGPDPGRARDTGCQAIGCERFQEGARDFVVNFRSPVKINGIANDEFGPTIGKLQALFGNWRLDGDV